MSFKFELRQRVTVPGHPFAQAIILSRSEHVQHTEPRYQLAWVDADAGVRDTLHSETDIVLANTRTNEETQVVSVKVSRSLTSAMPAKPARRKR